jgi:WD40 repeat protein
MSARRIVSRWPALLALLALLSLSLGVTGQEPTRRLDGHVRWLGGGFTVTKDGKQIAAPADAPGNNIILWDTSRGVRLKTIELTEDEGGRLAFSDDGKHLAIAGPLVRVVEIATGKTAFTVPAQAQPKVGYNPLLLDRVNRKLLAWTIDQTNPEKAAVHSIALWDLDTSKEVWRKTWMQVVMDTAINIDGTLLAVGLSEGDKDVVLLEPATGKEVGALTGHKDLLYSVALSPDGTRLATGTMHGDVKLWDVKNRKELAVRRAYESEDNIGCVHTLSFAADGRYLATGSFRNDDPTGKRPSLKVFRTDGLREVWTYANQKTPVYLVQFAPDGKTLLGGTARRGPGGDEAIMVWDWQAIQKGFPPERE